MDDGYEIIRPAFWALFDKEGLIAEKQEGPVIRCLYTDRQTYADWTKGDFVVWHSDGRKEAAYGVQINRADLEAAFGPMHHFQ